MKNDISKEKMSKICAIQLCANKRKALGGYEFDNLDKLSMHELSRLLDMEIGLYNEFLKKG